MSRREHYAAATPGETTTTSTAWSEAARLTFTPGVGKTYVVFWSVEAANKGNTTTDVRLRVAVDGASAVEANIESRSTLEYPSYSGFFPIAGDGAAKAVTIEVAAEAAGVNVAARNGNLVALALTGQDVYAESLGRTAVTSNAFTTVVSATWSPPAGDYLILASCLTDNFATTAPVYGRLEFDGAATPDTGAGHAEVAAGQASVVPLGMIWRRTVTAEGAKTAAWRVRAHTSNNEIGSTDNRLLILDLSGFDQAFYGEIADAHHAGTEASFTPALTVSGSASGNPHLVLAAWSVAALNNSLMMETRLVEDETPIGLSPKRTFSALFERGAFQGVVALRTGIGPGVRTWSVERRSDGTNTAAVRMGSALAALDLGADAEAYALAAESTDLALGGGTVHLSRGYSGPASTSAWSLTAAPAKLEARRVLRASAAALALAPWPAGLAARGDSAWTPSPSPDETAWLPVGGPLTAWTPAPAAAAENWS